jgi:hypothetical protein
MITANVDMTPLHEGIAALVHHVGLEAKLVVRTEMGELIKTLVRTSPPEDPKKTRDSIRESILMRFEMVDMNPHPKHQGKIGPSGILWYFWDEGFLRGVAPDKDMRDASVKELAVIRHQITPEGRRVLPFKHPRKKQRVLLYQNIAVKQATLKKLITQEQRKVGRLKAAWLVIVGAGRLVLNGGNQPPQWVRRHIEGARGDYDDNSEDKKSPKITITNYAKGINQKSVDSLVEMAVNIRGRAMQKNAAMMFEGRKSISSYKR